MAKPALGRGLGALLGGVVSTVRSDTPTTSPLEPVAPAGAEVVHQVELEKIYPSPAQPRKTFSEESIKELADSITRQGVVQPLIVRADGNRYELIAGERRWRAARLAGLKTVPVLVREVTPVQLLALALVENLQREDLNPIDEALGYSQLMERFHLTQEEISNLVGKNRSSVANALRLLQLAPEVSAMVRHGRLSVGHAKVLLSLPEPEKQKLAVEKIITGSLSVRQTEELVSLLSKPSSTVTTSGNGVPKAADPHVRSLESKLQEKFGTKVSMQYRKGKGKIDIRFFNDDDLARILEVIGINPD